MRIFWITLILYCYLDRAALEAVSNSPNGRLWRNLVDGQSEPVKPADASKAARQRSTIGFPYMDVDSAVKMAEAIHNNVGHGECADDQLAAWTNQSSKSSTFRVQVYASRTYGILGGEASRHYLTELGRRIVDPSQARSAKVEAFFNVPLYDAIYTKYKGGTLPPPAALEREIVSLGVSDKQKDRARQVFERSAEQAGFFEHGRSRLVQPGIGSQRSSPVGDSPPPPPPPPTGGGGAGGSTGDALLDALISKLPAAGTEWGVEERISWLGLMAMGFQITYGVATNIEIKKAST
jgi:hypothetical protein